MRLADRVCIVTGAASGIGEATSKLGGRDMCIMTGGQACPPTEKPSATNIVST